VSGVDTIHDAISEIGTLSYVLLLLIVCCLFPWVVGSSHLKTSAIEERVYNIFCFTIQTSVRDMTNYWKGDSEEKPGLRMA
jgi:hypothetical protein